VYPRKKTDCLVGPKGSGHKKTLANLKQQQQNNNDEYPSCWKEKKNDVIFITTIMCSPCLVDEHDNDDSFE
jgi:hypothetical protein